MCSYKENYFLHRVHVVVVVFFFLFFFVVVFSDVTEMDLFRFHYETQRDMGALVLENAFSNKG